MPHDSPFESEEFLAGIPSGALAAFVLRYARLARPVIEAAWVHGDTESKGILDDAVARAENVLAGAGDGASVEACHASYRNAIFLSRRLQWAAYRATVLGALVELVEVVAFAPQAARAYDGRNPALKEPLLTLARLVAVNMEGALPSPAIRELLSSDVAALRRAGKDQGWGEFDGADFQFSDPSALVAAASRTLGEEAAALAEEQPDPTWTGVVTRDRTVAGVERDPAWVDGAKYAEMKAEEMWMFSDREEDFAVLPRWACYAFAARCFERTRTMIDKDWPESWNPFLEAVADLAATAGRDLEQTDVAELLLPILKHTPTGESWKDMLPNALVALGECLTESPERCLLSLSLGGTTAKAAMGSKLGSVSDEIHLEVRRDFLRLRLTAAAEEWTDDTPVSQEFFGEMWPGKSEPGNSNCFVATACTGSDNHPDVVYLREFRDRCLGSTAAGRAFIAAYTRLSPGFARWIARSAVRRRLTHEYLVAPVVRTIRRLRRSP